MALSIRIKNNSPLQRIIDLLDADPTLTRQQLRAQGYQWSEIQTIWQLAQHSENYVRGRYTEVTQVIVSNQPMSTLPSDGQVGISAGGGMEETRWPEAPMVPERMRNFRKPVWYKRLAEMVDAGRHIALSGPPGIGKSTAVMQLAAEHKMPLVTIGADSGLRRRDLTGTVELVNHHTQFLVAEYAAATVNGWWAMIDEANAAEPDALMFLNAQIAPPYMVGLHGHALPVHPDFRLFITYNPGLVGTKPLPDSFKDRFFPIKLEFPSAKTLRGLLVANGMPNPASGGDEENHPWQDLVVLFGLKCWEQHTKGRCRYQITPRRLMDAVALITMGSEPHQALHAAVVDAVDNPAEAQLLSRLLDGIDGLESPPDDRDDGEE